MAEHGSDFKESGPQLGVPVSVRELDDVLFRDVGNKIANDGRYISSLSLPHLHTHNTYMCTHAHACTDMYIHTHKTHTHLYSHLYINLSNRVGT